jgi:hypothetical protein
MALFPEDGLTNRNIHILSQIIFLYLTPEDGLTLKTMEKVLFKELKEHFQLREEN